MSSKGDGAYDGAPVYQVAPEKQVAAAVIIPPHKTAVRSAAGDSQRDGQIADIAQRGRTMWRRDMQRALRDYVEFAIQR